MNIMFPEAVFVALSAPELYLWSSQYMAKELKQEENAKFPCSKRILDYLKDKAVDRYSSAVILGTTLQKVIGEDELEKLLKRSSVREITLYNYATQYVDKCNT